MFTKQDIINEVENIFTLNGVDITDDTSVNNMDSLEYMSILIGLEEKFNIEFPDSVLVKNMFESMDDFYLLMGFLLEDRYTEE